jgi:threonine aldolase
MIVDLRSDTLTRPTPGMRAAIAAAEVGDDVFGEDPTVNALEARVAALLGKDQGLFVPTGTMANQIAIRCLTEPGDEVILEADAHPFHYEAGGAAVISGVTIRLVQGDRGVLDPDVVRAAVRAPNVHHAPPRLLSVENTANRGGGTVIPAEHCARIAAAARAAGLHTHLDGARLWNAHVATGTALDVFAAPFDMVSVCFSKGLGAPVGSMLLGPADRMERARRFRKMLGGGMRQVGVLAAACDYALTHHLAGLADDHARALRLWEGLAERGWAVERRPESNMVYVRVPDAPARAEALAERGVRCIALAWDRIRLVTHLDVDDAGIDHALATFGAA